MQVKLHGLDPKKKYRITEINLLKTSMLKENGQIFSGDYLMKVGIDAFTDFDMHSRVIELSERQREHENMDGIKR